MSIVELARPEIRALAPYASARREASSGSVWLNANEAPDCGGTGLNRYPEPQSRELVACLAKLYRVATQQVLVTRGSDEGIDLLTRCFCRNAVDAILIAPPTFAMYAQCAAIQGAVVLNARLTVDLRLDCAALLAAMTPAVRLVYLCAPNNPTGSNVDPNQIMALAERIRGRALLVVDEAYVEFSGSPGVAASVADFENLAVLRTLSKAHALAGARVGALIADARIVELLGRIQAPYPLPNASVASALEALSVERLQATRVRIASTVAERDRVAAALTALPTVQKVWPSAGNFLLVRFNNATAVYRQLFELGIVVRDVSRLPQLTNCLRISIGSPAENNSLLAALADRTERDA